MNSSISKEALLDHVNSRLLEIHFGNTLRPRCCASDLEFAWERITYCFHHINLKHYRDDDNNSYFNHFNSDHMLALLYWLSHSAFKDGRIQLAEALFYVNKILHGIDLFYSVQLPNIFLPVHPVGTVIGHGDFSDFLVFYQNVTVGSNVDGRFPKFGKGNVLYSGVSVISNVTTGDNVIFGSNTSINSGNLSSNQLITGQFPNNIVRPLDRSVIRTVFRHP